MNYLRDSDCSDDSDNMKYDPIDNTKDDSIPFLQNLSDQSIIQSKEKGTSNNKNKFAFNNRSNSKSVDTIEPTTSNNNESYNMLSQSNTSKTKHIRRRRKISRQKKVNDMDIDTNNNVDMDDDHDWCADSMAVELSSVVCIIIFVI